MSKKKTTDIKKRNEERRAILDRIVGDLQENLIAAMIREPESDEETPIISVIFDGLGMEHDEVFGEFYFLPFPDEDVDFQHFSAVITIADEIKEEHLSELFEAMSYINFVLPGGSFCIDSEKQFLAFRLNVPLPADMDNEELYHEINIVMGNAVALTDIYMDQLLKIMDGEKSVEELKKEL